jgi:hypothetical protein
MAGFMLAAFYATMVAAGLIVEFLFQGLAVLDAKTGRLLAWRSPPLRGGTKRSPNITVLTLVGSRLYIGGFVDSIGGKRRESLAALSPSTGALLRWQPPKASLVLYSPDQILVARGQLIVSGFDGFGAFNLSTGRALSWPSRIRGRATRFAVNGPLLYLGANIEHSIDAVNGAPRNNLAVFNLATKRFTGWAPDRPRTTRASARLPRRRERPLPSRARSA